MNNEILLLKPTTENPTKILNEKLEKIKDFDSGFFYNFEIVNYDLKTFHNVMSDILRRRDCFMVLGELTEHGKDLFEAGKVGPRRKKKGRPTIQDKDGDILVLDLDDHIIPGFNALKPDLIIRRWLRKKKIDCDVTWQITSSQKLGTEQARLRLYFLADKEYSLIHRKAWSQSNLIQADGCVYTCSQPIYTAPPIIVDSVTGEPDKKVKDPIRKRHGFIKGKSTRFKIPEMTVEKINKYSGTSRGDTVYDFSDNTLPDDVLSGKVYRRYFMPMAFRYANLLKGDRDAIFSIVSARAMQVQNREFHPDNVYAYIDDAIAKINTEQEEKAASKTEVVTRSEIIAESKSSAIKCPEFPENIIDSWPEPWPMLWRNFCSVPRELEQCLLLPTFLSLMSHALRANYLTEYGRRPNFFFLNLTPSTGNKDVNSKNVIRDLDLAFRKRGSTVSLFTGLLNTESSITSDTSFLQSFSEQSELFWINTEASRIFQQLKTAGAVSSVAALSDKLIEVVDGHEITGKSKSGHKVKNVMDPNVHILFYAQPETIERYIDEDIVDSGLFGRALISIVPSLKFDVDSYSMFMPDKDKVVKVEDDFYNFLTSKEFNMSSMSVGKLKLAPSKKRLRILDKWARDEVASRFNDNETLQKVLSRLGACAEQLYTTILAVCQLYDSYKNRPIRKGVEVKPMLPLLEYWRDTKIYAIQNLVSTAMDPLAEEIMEIIKDFLSGKLSLKSFPDYEEIVTIHSMIGRAIVLNALRSRVRLIRKLSQDGDKKNATIRASQILDTLVKSGNLVEERFGNKICLGIPKG